MSKIWCCCCSDSDEEKASLCQSGRVGENQTITTQPNSSGEQLREPDETMCGIDGNKKEGWKVIERQIKDLEAKVQSHREESERFKAENSEIKKNLKDLQKINDELLTRLSAQASAKLTDNNPNIADLSDVNRPTKLSEQFSELYDNEWTYAFEELAKGQEDITAEKEACYKLLKILLTIYSICHKKASNDLSKMEQTLLDFNGMDVPPKEVLKTLKDYRKKHYTGTLNQVVKECQSSLRDTIPSEKASLIQEFINKCVSVCWLMVIQDPPVFINVSTDLHGEHLSTEIYKPYTQSGKAIDYLVWPVLYLFEGGQILSKGIAQGMIDEGSHDNADVKSEDIEITMTEDNASKSRNNGPEAYKNTDFEPSKEDTMEKMKDYSHETSKNDSKEASSYSDNKTTMDNANTRSTDTASDINQVKLESYNETSKDGAYQASTDSCNWVNKDSQTEIPKESVQEKSKYSACETNDENALKVSTDTFPDRSNECALELRKKNEIEDSTDVSKNCDLMKNGSGDNTANKTTRL